MSEERQLSKEEMAQAEKNAAHDLDAWVVAFKNFPVEANIKGVVDRLWAYQREWMQGRIRP